MRIDLVTLFPEIFSGLLAESLLGKAIEGGLIRIRTKSPREFGVGRHRKIDDTPYGGGSGMLMRVDCVVAALEALDSAEPELLGHRILLTPQGQPLRQNRLAELAGRPALTLIAGRYEGFDERVRSFVHEEISLGDFVLAGGEIAAMAIIEGVARLLPGVLGNEASTQEESFGPKSGGLLEYPQYTRPFEYRGLAVPDVLAGGNHGEIARWRQEQARIRTEARRPDLPRLPESPGLSPRVSRT